MNTDYISFALQQVRTSLAKATYDAGLTRSSETVPQSAARWWKARVKTLTVILRRLIMLMALNLTLDPPKPRVAKTAAPEEEPVLTKAQIPYSIALSGQTQVYTLDGPDFPEGSPGASGPVSVASLMRRFEALARILPNPETYAVRVARIMERQRRAGAPRPLCLPIATHRLKPELGAVAAGLPMLLADAFGRWNDSS
ncbi:MULTISPECIES: hypothetical protein [Hyphomonas]|uniref:Uncharacterized protein n=1 Tax=Hyphomonas adhaerens TaxID=81029 RepID=A0A3B9H0S8_9PROT|nr:MULTISPECIES: hypothetical protein [Hyphomonas]MBB41088.1 hypothetical protein [Hyphomonas sp.]HAE28307.1 hypothetical protein [Hyphomonas adhaerens]|tara:strand:+ start:9148 stop:9741 length:594 start_codon:yes stop_codon:yes gene_type:complete